MSESMRAIVISKFGGPEVLEYQDVAKPVPGPDEVLIRVHAFGVNHAEMHMRKGEWDEWNPVTGLECVGTIEAHPLSSPSPSQLYYPPGTKVAAVMGGLGRTRPGSYGEYITVSTRNIIPLTTTLPWPHLAALPEVYCTAYTALFKLLDLKRDETLLLRGATSTLGQAALHLAVDAGAAVTATTRRAERFAWLREELGAAEAVREERNLSFSGRDEGRGGKTPRFDKTLNLIGNSVLLESIALTRAGGRMVQAGWLGGLEPVRDFDPMVQMESGVHFSLFHSKVLGTPEFALSDIPLQEIVRKIEQGVWDARPARVFEYQDIVNAHRALDSHDVGGKIVVRH
ncbi:GroES-like protein [Xylaria sp. FL1042]|nr:GroES-like protein [Xylaria sp. FL1042]